MTTPQEQRKQHEQLKQEEASLLILVQDAEELNLVK